MTGWSIRPVKPSPMPTSLFWRFPSERWDLWQRISARISSPGATVTDVGSVKRPVIDIVAPHIPGHVHFIPGHPLAGTEHSGPRSGFATLFENRWCLLIPERENRSRGIVAAPRAMGNDWCQCSRDGC